MNNRRGSIALGHKRAQSTSDPIRLKAAVIPIVVSYPWSDVFTIFFALKANKTAHTSSHALTQHRLARHFQPDIIPALDVRVRHSEPGADTMISRRFQIHGMPSITALLLCLCIEAPWAKDAPSAQTAAVKVTALNDVRAKTALQFDK